MSLLGTSFEFDGVPCEQFDLMVYNIGGSERSGGDFAGTSSIVSESIPYRWRPLHYGARLSRRLEFTLTFGVNEGRIDSGQYLDRYELEAIASWLTGYDEYKWLVVQQDDMRSFRYHCMFTSLKQVTYGDIPWALEATVTCDSPFAYMFPQVFKYTLDGEQTVQILNESSLNRWYEPKIEYEPDHDGTLEITNADDNGRSFKFTDLPAAVLSLEVDNENGVITNSADLDVYPYFNYQFLRLKRGYNTLTLNGHGKLRIICEFPVNIGG